MIVLIEGLSSDNYTMEIPENFVGDVALFMLGMGNIVATNLNGECVAKRWEDYGVLEAWLMEKYGKGFEQLMAEAVKGNRKELVRSLGSLIVGDFEDRVEYMKRMRLCKSKEDFDKFEKKWFKEKTKSEYGQNFSKVGRDVAKNLMNQ